MAMTDQRSTVLDVVPKMEACVGPESLWQLAIDVFTERGFPVISYLHFPPLGAIDQGKIILVVHGAPQQMVQSYIDEKLFLTDPIPAIGINRTEPFYWNQIRELAHLSKDQEEIIRNREKRGNPDGIAIQAFGPNQRNGYFGFGFSEERNELGLIEIRDMQCICQLLHLRYCGFVQQHQPKVPRLSTREQEILEWVARGKSNSVIAEIMGLSTHTVDAYLRRIFLKLGATDRITATVKGIGNGLIRGATPKKPSALGINSA